MHRKRFTSCEAPITISDVLCVAVAMFVLLIGTEAWAQTSGSTTIVSDYRYRGVSLSEGHSAAQIHLGYDSPSGWYAGGFASSAKLDYVNAEQLIAYSGYARRLSSGLSWEAGVSNALFLGASSYNYAEAFVGLTSDNLSGRVYISPNYFGVNSRTLYAEINGAYPLRESFHLLAHIGFLHPLSNADRPASDTISRFDSRIGIGASVADWSAQLAWVTIEESRTKYLHYEDRNPHALVLSIAYSF